MASHDLANTREVGWPSAGIGEHGGDLAEVVGAEHSRRDDRKRLRVQVAAVIEMMDRAAPCEVLVSSTVKDLVVGSGIDFQERGAHELRGIPGEWKLFSVS